MRRGAALASVATAGAVVAATAAGIAAVAPSASAAQVTRATLAYVCRFPSGTDRVTALIRTTFAPTATAGQAIGPFGVTITAHLPIAALPDLASLGARSVQATVRLSAIEQAHSQSQQVPWRARTTRAEPIPSTRAGTGALVISATGTTPPAPAQDRARDQAQNPAQRQAPGLVTFTAGDLAIALQPTRPDGIAEGDPTRVSCVPDGTAPPSRLAAITISPAAPKSTASPSPSGSPQRRPGKHKFPRGCGKIKEVGNGVATCGYVTGFADVSKLIGAALLQPRRGKPGLVNVDFAEHHQLAHRKLIEHSTGELLFRGHHELPPVTATFLAFRFVPVTATLHLTELNAITIISASGITAPPFPITVRASSKVAVRVTNVRVNGVPLAVGAGCRTARPLSLVVTGQGDNTLPPKGYTVPTGGPLSGRVTIPPFVHCGTTEDLDPLLTGSISGRGNFTKLTQGKLCGPSQPADWTCPPPVPRPHR